MFRNLVATKTPGSECASGDECYSGSCDTLQDTSFLYNKSDFDPVQWDKNAVEYEANSKTDTKTYCQYTTGMPLMTILLVCCCCCCCICMLIAIVLAVLLVMGKSGGAASG